MRFFAFSGIIFPFLMTALGAAVVFLFRRNVSSRAQRICLGFAAGVMASAAVFSLLVPAIEQLAVMGAAAWLTASIAFLTGALLILALDLFLSRAKAAQRSGDEAHRRALLITAVTLHNVPEGMAVGLAFAAAADGGAGAAAAAATVALGIGLQNLPEGAAISLPLRQGGMSRRRSFALGTLSGVVEPVAAVVVLLLSSALSPVLPALMAFSAGAMMVVVFAELSPASTGARDGAIAAVLGYALMMALDVGLG